MCTTILYDGNEIHQEKESGDWFIVMPTEGGLKVKIGYFPSQADAEAIIDTRLCFAEVLND
ncbi:hypothetical protein C6499_19135 [Candidatus Poribacteria bacterium]|nr:MAG: hypothetical protein C6499_19135 [Candidatus Poribacteria bacterium]